MGFRKWYPFRIHWSFTPFCIYSRAHTYSVCLFSRNPATVPVCRWNDRICLYGFLDFAVNCLSTSVYYTGIHDLAGVCEPSTYPCRAFNIDPFYWSVFYPIHDKSGKKRHFLPRMGFSYSHGIGSFCLSLPDMYLSGLWQRFVELGLEFSGSCQRCYRKDRGEGFGTFDSSTVSSLGCGVRHHWLVYRSNRFFFKALPLGRIYLFFNDVIK